VCLLARRVWSMEGTGVVRGVSEGRRVALWGRGACGWGHARSLWNSAKFADGGGGLCGGEAGAEAWIFGAEAWICRAWTACVCGGGGVWWWRVVCGVGEWGVGFVERDERGERREVPPSIFRARPCPREVEQYHFHTDAERRCR